MILVGWLRKVQPPGEENNFLFPDPDFDDAQSLGRKIVWRKLCHVLKKVYTFYINTKIRLQFKYNPKIDLQSPFFCNNISIYNSPV